MPPFASTEMTLLLTFALFTIIIAPMLYWNIKHEEQRARILGTRPNHAMEILLSAVILAVWIFITIVYAGAYYAATLNGS